MKYWAHINNEVKGPFEAAALGAVAGFTPATLVFPDGAAQGTPWKAAAACPEVLAALKPSPEPAPPAAPAPAAAPPAEDKLMLTMRGSLIDPELAELMKKAAPGPKPAAVTSGVLEPPLEAPAPVPAPVPAPAPAAAPVDAGRAGQTNAALDRLAAELASVSKAQADLAGRLEAAAKELKALRG